VELFMMRRALVVVLSLIVTGLFVACSSREISPPVPPRTESPLQGFDLAPGIGHMTPAFGSLWVVGSNDIFRFDPSDGSVIATIPVQGITAVGDGGALDHSEIAAGGGFIWLTAEPDLMAIDPGTNAVDHRIAEESGVSRITFADGAVVVGGSAEGNGDVRLLDPQTGDYLWQRPVGNLQGYPSILVTDDWFWAGGRSNAGGEALGRVSKDGTAQQVIADVVRFDSFAEVEGSVWVTGGDSLWRVDDAYGGPAPSPQSVFPEEVHAVTATLSVDGPAIVRSDGTNLWLLETGNGVHVTPLDPTTGERIGPAIALGHAAPAELAVVDGRPWISFGVDGTLVTVSN
jgi:hypothetical protein